MQLENYFTAFLRAAKATPRAAVRVATRAKIGVLSPVVVAPVVVLLEDELDEELLDEELLEDELDVSLLDEVSLEDELDVSLLDVAGVTPSFLATLSVTSSHVIPVSALPSASQSM